MGSNNHHRDLDWFSAVARDPTVVLSGDYQPGVGRLATDIQMLARSGVALYA